MNELVEIYENMKFKYLIGDAVYHTLHDAITRNILSQGTRLKDSDIADALDVSRASVRDALQILLRDGLVEPIPGSGYAVTTWTYDKCLDVSDYMCVLQIASVKAIENNITDKQIKVLEEKSLTLEKVDEYKKNNMLMEIFIEYMDFYIQIARFSDNPYLVKELSVVTDKIITMRQLYPVEIQKDFYFGAYAFAHRQVIDALKGKDRLQPASKILEKYIDNEIVVRHMYNVHKYW